ncbi:hypothetical protein AOLI_G00201330 [Acnodon oligacanthus]
MTGCFAAVSFLEGVRRFAHALCAPSTQGHSHVRCLRSGAQSEPPPVQPPPPPRTFSGSQGSSHDEHTRTGAVTWRGEAAAALQHQRVPRPTPTRRPRPHLPQQPWPQCRPNPSSRASWPRWPQRQPEWLSARPSGMWWAAPSQEPSAEAAAQRQPNQPRHTRNPPGLPRRRLAHASLR